MADTTLSSAAAAATTTVVTAVSSSSSSGGGGTTKTKRSKIVSEPSDDLEESLMLEFNIRLKTCMDTADTDQQLTTAEAADQLITAHQEDLTEEPTTTIMDDNSEQYLYENVEIIKTNGKTEFNLTEDSSVETENNSQCSVIDFIEIERENIILENGGSLQKTEVVIEGSLEAETVPNKPTKLDLPIPTITNFTEDFVSSPDVENQDGRSSAKNRMLLSTDEASCLLFTQTVTSPMLTPSEENIDFLKGFQRESSQNTLSDTSPRSDEELIIYENVDKDPKDADQPLFLMQDELDIVKDIQQCEALQSSPHQHDDNDKDEGIDIDSTVPSNDEDAQQIIQRNSGLFDHITDHTSIFEEFEQQRATRDDYPMIPSVRNLKSQYIKSANTENLKMSGKEKTDIAKLKSLDIMKQISKFEQNSNADVTAVCNNGSTAMTEMITESAYHVETIETKSTVTSNQEKSLKKKKSKKSRHEKENISVKSSFSKFDALQKKNVLHVRSTDSSKATEKFNGNGNQADVSNCKSCGKVVFQMEQMKAEKCIWHKNCFRCAACNKQLTVDTYQSHEGTLYCKPHFKALFTPKAVEDNTPQKPRKHELIIRENQPLELPPDVVRASDKPDLGLDELQSLNVKERFQVFEHHGEEENQLERNHSGAALNVKRSASILSKLARFQAKGMDVGVADDVLNGIPIEESSSSADEDDEAARENGEDVELVRAKRAQKEKPFHFIGMSDVKSKWESTSTSDQSRDERREERKQEIQSIRSRLFMGKQGKMKEAYQQAVFESESGVNVKKSSSTTMAAEVADANAKSIKERFEKGGMQGEGEGAGVKELDEDMQVFESGISKKSRSIFLELDANASKAAPLSPISPQRSATNTNIAKARDAFVQRDDVVKSTKVPVDDVAVETAAIQQKFNFFEAYREPEKQRKQFRITPPREGQQLQENVVQSEVYRDPNVIRAEEAIVEDSVVAKQTHTATKMLNKFRQMEENGTKEQLPQGPKPLKRFTPPPVDLTARRDSGSSEYSSSSVGGSEEEDDDDDDAAANEHHLDNGRSPSSGAALPDADLIEAQKAARAKQLRAKFERWEANQIRKEGLEGGICVVDGGDEEAGQVESTKSLRARFESMKETTCETKSPRIKVNRFVDMTNSLEICQGCKKRVYPLEKISVHGYIYHKKCFKCMECNTILRMDSYSYNQGLLYCTHHFKRLFISKGNYDTAFGLEQHKEKWNTTVA